MAELSPPMVLVLGQASLSTAQRIADALPGARIAGLSGRVDGADDSFTHFGEAIRAAYQTDTPVIALCAAGIVIRALAPLLEAKMAEPPVLVVAEDGSAVVPLLGASRGVNDLARTLGRVLNASPAITTTGELRFGVNLLNPPPGYRLLNPDAAKTFISDLLSGRPVQIDGEAAWLEFSDLPVDPSSRRRIRIVSEPVEIGENELVYHYTPPRGRLAVIGLGPGDSASRTPAVTDELRRAEHVLGYETYVRMAGPFRPDQQLHPSDNRQELDRARHALTLAARGFRVVLVSSGDPGIFAMAAATLEALHDAEEAAWHDVDLVILPGISAAMATAAKAGAPLGHDFAVLSLSDNLKPWHTIATRLEAALGADMVLALYNPVSRARPYQLDQALAIIARFRAPTTPIVIGTDIGRPGEVLTTTTLEALSRDLITSRSVLIVGSSVSQSFARADGTAWVYAPRWYRPES